MANKFACLSLYSFTQLDFQVFCSVFHYTFTWNKNLLFLHLWWRNNELNNSWTMPHAGWKRHWVLTLQTFLFTHSFAFCDFPRFQITHGKLRSENISWRIPDINKALIFNCTWSERDNKSDTLSLGDGVNHPCVQGIHTVYVTARVSHSVPGSVAVSKCLHSNISKCWHLESTKKKPSSAPSKRKCESFW